MKIKKRTAILILVILGLGTLFYFNQSLLTKRGSGDVPGRLPGERQYAADEALRGKEGQRKVVTVTLDFGDGKKTEEKIEAETVYAALEKISQENGFQISSTEYKYGSMIDSIGQATNSATSYWIYSVNGKPGQIAADRYYLQPDDSVEWKYVKK